MKKAFLIVLLSATSFLTHAQDEPAPGKRQQNIEALKVAFITRQLQLTPQEAEQFWPVYNQYSQELKATFADTSGDVLDRDEHILNIRKKYKESFIKILGADRVNQLFEAEIRFRQLLIRAIRRQNQNRTMNGGYGR